MEPRAQECQGGAAPEGLGLDTLSTWLHWEVQTSRHLSNEATTAPAAELNSTRTQGGAETTEDKKNSRAWP